MVGNTGLYGVRGIYVVAVDLKAARVRLCGTIFTFGVGRMNGRWIEAVDDSQIEGGELIPTWSTLTIC